MSWSALPDEGCYLRTDDANEDAQNAWSEGDSGSSYSDFLSLSSSGSIGESSDTDIGFQCPSNIELRSEEPPGSDDDSIPVLVLSDGSDSEDGYGSDTDSSSSFSCSSSSFSSSSSSIFSSVFSSSFSSSSSFLLLLL